MSNYEKIPLLALRGLVVFPGMQIYFDVARIKSIKAVDAAMENDQCLFLAAQKDSMIEDPEKGDIYETGTVIKISQVLKLPNKMYRIVAKGIEKARLSKFIFTEPWFECSIIPLNETNIIFDGNETEAYSRTVKEMCLQYLDITKNNKPEITGNIISVEDPATLANLVCSELNIGVTKLQKLLEQTDISELLKDLVNILENELQILELEQDISDRARQNIDEQQKEYFLREKYRAIRDELGYGEDEDDDIEQYKQDILALGLLPEHEEKLLKEVSRLSYHSPQSAEYSVLRNYLDIVLELPWNETTQEELDIVKAETILNRDHFGLKKVKERILEMFAVRKLCGKNDKTILCLAGPPGIGKTSIAKSVAEALGRNFVRISLGGVKDESEIRGHRRTYIGAMPGKIISALNQAKSKNPLILFDEIDKLGSDYKGDPSSAMLEVLDGEQNFEFKDNYIGIPFDLSDVLFITTANDVSSIPSPLRDRMEIIDLPSYTSEEKFNIAKKHLLPKQLEKHNLTSVTVSDSVINKLIEQYTREAGVRELERVISKICRVCAKKTVSENKTKISVSNANLTEFAGKAKYRNYPDNNKDKIGVVTGLAWTQAGGEVLYVEASVMPGNGRLEITGNLGDVMQESARAAYSYVRANSEKFNLPDDFYKKIDVHIHVPEGAVPKDGPSAGVTISTALVSVLTGKKVSGQVAMTGEISLTGRVMAIGGLKEKTLAAYKQGIKTVVVPFENKPDFDDLANCVKENIKFVYAKKIDDVLKVALLEEGKINRYIAKTEVKNESAQC